MEEFDCKPLISIVLPTYNVEKYIERCLLSCVRQTFGNIEIIVVDDCGVDGSIEIAKNFSKKDSRIKIVHNPQNLGTLLARKSGADAAQGKYIIFLDPDDSLALNAVELLYSEAQRTSAEIVIFGIEIRPKAGFLRSNIFTPPKVKGCKSPLQAISFNATGYSWGTAGKMYLNSLVISAFNEISFIPERLVYAEDALFTFAAVSLASSYASVPVPLYHYYSNIESITKVTSPELIERNCAQIDLIVKYIMKLSSSPAFHETNRHCLARAVKKLNGNLLSDKALLNRHSLDPITGTPLYAKALIHSYSASGNLKAVVKLIIYLLTFKSVKF